MKTSYCVKYALLSLIAFFFVSVPAARVTAQDFNCFAVLAGKGATADGSVLLGHNEDDSGEQMLNIYVVPANGERGSAKYLWAEFPGIEVADAFMNEYGVCIVSNSCPSVEEREDWTEGGVLYEVRLNVAKYARTAREAVKLIGGLVEKYGYKGSGRTYSVADRNEGWCVSIVRGRHWVARRVPDNMVMVLPNNYIIERVDLSDTVNFAGSADLVEYAVERGWYNPDGSEFSFKKVYGSPAHYVSDRNVYRHKKALEYLTGRNYTNDPDTYEFAVVPYRKLTLKNVMEILSIHNYDAEGADKGAHPQCICYDATVLSTIFQLRPLLPKDIGCIMWTAAGPPCIEPYVPWHLGMGASPKRFMRFSSPEEAEARHLSDSDGLRKNYKEGIYWDFADRWDSVSKDYAEKSKPLVKRRDKLQKFFFKAQRKTERNLMKTYFDRGVMTLQYPSPVETALDSLVEEAYRKMAE